MTYRLQLARCSQCDHARRDHLDGWECFECLELGQWPGCDRFNERIIPIGQEEPWWFGVPVGLSWWDRVWWNIKSAWLR